MQNFFYLRLDYCYGGLDYDILRDGVIVKRVRKMCHFDTFGRQWSKNVNKVFWKKFPYISTFSRIEIHWIQSTRPNGCVTVWESDWTGFNSIKSKWWRKCATIIWILSMPIFCHDGLFYSYRVDYLFCVFGKYL